MAMREDWGDRAFNRYGFVDALNPTLRTEATVHHGRVIGGVGWFDVGPARHRPGPDPRDGGEPSHADWCGA